jgi:AraC-like DNA-binding protein
MFIPTTLETVFNVEKIITIHYFEYARDFIFSGEKHNFWEFVYIDKGEVGVMADNDGYTLKEGEIIFHRPNEYHNIWANGVYANVIIVTFCCLDKAMDFFVKKILSLDPSQKNLLFQILEEGKNTFSEPLDILYQTKITKIKNPPFGSEQLIKIYLEQFLISLIRSDKAVLKKTDMAAKNENEDRIVESIVHFLKQNINSQLRLDDVCKNICFSKSYVKQLFSRKKSKGIIQFFNDLKIDESKRLISENNLSITEISEMLGFSSVHYFSRAFKNKTGMSPKEYAKSANDSLL